MEFCQLNSHVHGEEIFECGFIHVQWELLEVAGIHHLVAQWLKFIENS